MQPVNNLIGNTPLICIEPGLYAKFECYNPSGSIKDRIVQHILSMALEAGELLPGQRLVEASSGNSGIATAMMGAAMGHPVTILLPCNMSEERKQMIHHFGAELVEVAAGDFAGAIRIRDELALQHGWFNVNQFHNQENVRCHYLGTGAEIVEQIKPFQVHAFVSGTGTGGTIMGVGQRLRESFPQIQIIAVEPAENPVMVTGVNNGRLHGIQGIGDGSKFLANLSKIDHIIPVSTQEAIEESSRLARTMGLLVGISSAANVIAARKFLAEHPESNVVTILPDRGERYLSVFNAA